MIFGGIDSTIPAALYTAAKDALRAYQDGLTEIISEKFEKEKRVPLLPRLFDRLLHDKLPRQLGRHETVRASGRKGYVRGSKGLQTPDNISDLSAHATYAYDLSDNLW